MPEQLPDGALDPANATGPVISGQQLAEVAESLRQLQGLPEGTEVKVGQVPIVIIGEGFAIGPTASGAWEAHYLDPKTNDPKIWRIPPRQAHQNPDP